MPAFFGSIEGQMAIPVGRWVMIAAAIAFLLINFSARPR